MNDKTTTIGVPSFQLLESLGADAGPYFDALFDEFDRAIAMADAAGDVFTRKALQALLKNLEKRHREYFSEGDAA